MSEYQGWTNYETWATALWLGNDEGTYTQTREMARVWREDAPDSRQVREGTWTVEEAARYNLADALKDYVESSCLPDLGGSLAADLLNAAVSEIDWTEIADNLLSE